MTHMDALNNIPAAERGAAGYGFLWLFIAQISKMLRDGALESL